jgi:hypothetical protein
MVKKWVALFKGGDFSTFLFPCLAKDLSAPGDFTASVSKFQ